MLAGSRVSTAGPTNDERAAARAYGVDGRGDRRALRTALLGVDIMGLAVAVTAAGVLRFPLDGVLPVSSLAPERHLIASILVVPVVLLLLNVHGLYDYEHVLSGTREYARIAHACTYGVVIVLAASYLAGGGPLVSRSWVLLVWALSIGGVGLGRFGVRRVVRWLRRHGVLRTRVVIVGASTAGVAIANQLTAAENEGIDVVGFLDEYLPVGQALVPGAAVIGRPSDLVQGFNTSLADEYILVTQAIPHERLEEITRLMASHRGAVIRLAVNSAELFAHGLLLGELAGVPLLTLCQARLMGLEAMLKRALDVSGASLALVALAPLLAAVLIRACLTRAPTIFSRQHIFGAGCEKIELWLLAAEVSTSLPLRGIPALLAVLVGHLSLVGPRPTIWTPNAPVPTALWLTAVKPGLTGPWRLSGPGASLADQAMEDLSYVRNYSIWEDLRILSHCFRCVRMDGVGSLLGRWERNGNAFGSAPVDASATLGPS